MKIINWSPRKGSCAHEQKIVDNCTYWMDGANRARPFLLHTTLCKAKTKLLQRKIGGPWILRIEKCGDSWSKQLLNNYNCNCKLHKEPWWPKACSGYKPLALYLYTFTNEIILGTRLCNCSLASFRCLLEGLRTIWISTFFDQQLKRYIQDSKFWHLTTMFCKLLADLIWEHNNHIWQHWPFCQRWGRV